MPGPERDHGGREDQAARRPRRPDHRTPDRRTPEQSGGEQSGGERPAGRAEGHGGENNERPARRHASEHDADEPRALRRAGIGGREAARQAARHVLELTGRDPLGVTSLERSDSGWRIGIEVLETQRIPDSTDILAVYRVEVDEHGDLVSYRRERRYYRGRAEEADA